MAQTRTLIYAVSPLDPHAEASVNGDYLNGWFPPLDGMVPRPSGFTTTTTTGGKVYIKVELDEPRIDPDELAEDPHAGPSYDNALDIFLCESGKPRTPSYLDDALIGWFKTAKVIATTVIQGVNYDIIAQYVED